MPSFSTLTAGEHSVPLWLLQGDKRGRLTSTEARDELLARVSDGTFRDVYIFAHGWNNGFDRSLELFEAFFKGFLQRRPATPGWKPVFVGIQWPSIVLVFPWEKGPQIAAAGMAEAEQQFQARASALISDQLGDTDGARFEELARRPSLEGPQQREFVRLARAAIGGGEPEMPLDAVPSEDELLASWQVLEQAARPASPTTGEFGFADERAQAVADPQAAGLLDKLDPRQLVRGATVYVMKDRAGTIGATMLRPVVEQMTAARAQVRLIGHSYGGRVVLAALSTGAFAFPVRSALLLQPAVNQYCFAAPGRIPQSQGPGGFRRALEQVRLPIYSTFSPHDFPLHDTFHLALRRAKDLGEAEIAAGAPPSIYCALGGYGPQAVGEGLAATLPIEDHGTFGYPASARVVGLDGAGNRITGHGDVTNAFACWALVEQDARAVGP